jgi:hypothetical protein
MLGAASDNRRLRVMLAELAPTTLDGNALMLSPAANAALAAERMRGDIEALARRLTGVDVSVVISKPDAPAGGPIASVESVAEHPLVKHAVELFGGRVIGVQPRRDRGQ